MTTSSWFFTPRLASRRLVRFPLRLALLSVAAGYIFCMGLAAQRLTFTGANSAVDFGNVNLCAVGKTKPAPCSETLTLTYNVTASGTLGVTRVVTGGAANLDFTMADGSSCTGAVTTGNSCVVKVKFAPTFAGSRRGAVVLTDASGNPVLTTPVYGVGYGSQVAFEVVGNVSGRFALPPLPGGYPKLTGSIAVDSAGDVYLADGYEYPADGSGWIQLPFHDNTKQPLRPGVAVDGAGNVFVSHNGLLELPAGGSAWTTLPFSGLQETGPLAADGVGDLFVVTVTGGLFSVVEIPFGCRSDACLITRFTGSAEGDFTAASDIPGLVADTAGNLSLYQYVTDKTNGYSGDQLVTVPAGGAPVVDTYNRGPGMDLAMDSVGGLFTLVRKVQDVPSRIVGPGLLQLTYDGGDAIAVDPGGNVFLTSFAEGRVYEFPGSVPATVDLGATPVGVTTNGGVYIVNKGPGQLTLTHSIDNPDMRRQEVSACTARTNNYCDLGIAFTPSVASEQFGELRVETNAPLTPLVRIRLRGNGTPAVATPVFSVPSGVYGSAQTVSITDSQAGASIHYTTDGTSPTAASRLYSVPIVVASTERLSAIAVAGGASSAMLTAVYSIVPTATDIIDESQSFFGAQPLQLNGRAAALNNKPAFTGPYLHMTDLKKNETGSAFYPTEVDVRSFTTYFGFQLQGEADGITFAIQRDSASALGGISQGLGYSTIGHSVAIKFDLHGNGGEGSNSTGLYVNGALPTTPAIDLTTTGLNLHSGSVILAGITYDGVHLVLTLTDTLTNATWSHSFTIDIPATIGGTKAYVGFTGSTGQLLAHQDITSWTFAGGVSAAGPPIIAPALPTYPEGFSALGLTMNGSATIALGSTDNSTLVNGQALQLTDDSGSSLAEAASAFYTTPVNIQSFVTDFTFQLLPTSPFHPSIADGITFTIQDVGPAALGLNGKSLGYASIGKSVAVKFDPYDNSGEGPSSTGLYINGALPTVPSIDLRGTGLDLHSLHSFAAHIAYDGTNLVLTLKDSLAAVTWSHSFAVDIPAIVGGHTAYVGFTAGTGGENALQSILTWTFKNP